MNIDIHAGMRGLVKINGSWCPCELVESEDTRVTPKGLYLQSLLINMSNDGEDIENEDTIDHEYCEELLQNYFLEAFPIDDWVKEHSKYFMTKEDYITFIEDEDFNRQLENAYVSDGKYGYYSVAKYTRNWIEKQPFKYIVRGD